MQPPHTLQMMQEQKVFRAIIIVKNNITPFAKTAIKEMAMRNYRMEYFRDAELLVGAALMPAPLAGCLE